MLRFDGRVALITGAGRGLGRAYAKMLASRGCSVVVNDLGVDATGANVTEDPAAKVVEEIRSASGNAVADRHDVVREAPKIIETAISAFGRLDIVVNNAGVFKEGALANVPADIWHANSDVHYRGTVEVCRAAWSHLVSAGAGRIINTSSSALLGNAGATSYGSAKGAVLGFTRCLAEEGRAVGINVNAIMPSAITRLTSSIGDPTILKAMQEHFQPERVAAFVAWLAHADTQVTMATFRVSGGRASRVVVATTPSVAAADDSPDSWSKQGTQLLSQTTLIEMHNALESLSMELKDADPTLDFGSAMAGGGLDIGRK